MRLAVVSSSSAFLSQNAAIKRGTQHLFSEDSLVDALSLPSRLGRCGRPRSKALSTPPCSRSQRSSVRIVPPRASSDLSRHPSCPRSTNAATLKRTMLSLGRSLTSSLSSSLSSSLPTSLFLRPFSSSAVSTPVLSLNDLTYMPNSQRQKRRVGRGVGSGRGKTCGRGHKGRRARSGGTVKVRDRGRER